MTRSWTSQVSDPSFRRALDRLVLARRRRSGEETTRSRGLATRASGLEWVGHRPYQPGDDLRYLDWHVLARLGRPYVRRFVTEHAERLDLLIDTSRSMTLGDPPKDDVARALAFVFGYVASAAGDRVASACYADGLLATLPAARGASHRARLLNFLVEAPTGGPTSLASSVKSFSDRTAEVGRVVVISDLLDDTVESGLTMLRDRGFEVIVLRLVAERDERPRLPGESTLLVDVETGSSRQVVFGPHELDQYQRQRRAEAERAARFCAGAHIAFADLSSGQPLPRLVFHDLRVSGLLS